MASEGSACEQATAAAAAATAARSTSTFKLRFAAQREPGRSYVSPVKPLGLPATVTGKFYCREEPAAVDEERTQRALHRIDDMFKLGPRDKYSDPITASQVYGWHAARAGRPPPGLEHRIRDSGWLKERLRVLAADYKLKHP